MAYLAGLGGDRRLYADHIRPAADFLVAHGPSFGVERWEEQSGYSPSTIAAEIAGLTAAAGHRRHARRPRPRPALPGHRRRLPAHRSRAGRSPPPARTAPRYFIRLSKNGDPNSAITYSLGNGGVDADQRAVVDGGFQELVRLGELPADDADVQASLTVLDQQTRHVDADRHGLLPLRHVARRAARTATATATSRTRRPARTDGQPWPTDRHGVRATCGRCCPASAPSRRWPPAIAAWRAAQLGFMLGSASGVGLVPEQAWENPDLAAAPYGSDPTTASIGFRNGHPAGSAAPLTWAQAQELRLLVDLSSRPDRRPPRPHHAPVRRPGAAGAGRRHHHRLPLPNAHHRRAHHGHRHRHARRDGRRQPRRQRHPGLRPGHRDGRRRRLVVRPGATRCSAPT